MRSGARVRHSLGWVMAGGLLLCSACSDRSDLTAPPTEMPGTLTVHWITPHGTEGAVRLTLRGPGIGTVTSVEDEAVVFTRSNGSRHHVAVLGRANTGALLRFEVPDTRRADLYSVTIVEVADVESSDLRDDLSDYRAMVK